MESTYGDYDDGGGGGDVDGHGDGDDFEDNGDGDGVDDDDEDDGLWAMDDGCLLILMAMTMMVMMSIMYYGG